MKTGKIDLILRGTISVSLHSKLSQSQLIRNLATYRRKKNFQLKMADQGRKLSIGTWNMHCNFDISGEYLKTLSKRAQIIVIQEHGLYPCEIYKMNSILKGYCGDGKPSNIMKDEDFGNRRVGGCGILWEKSLQFKVVRHPKEGSDRIYLIELKLSGLRVFIFCIYLPHQTCKISSYENELKILCTMLDKYRAQGMCIIIGDTNISFGAEYGARCSGSSYPNVRPFMKVMHAYDLTVVDIGKKGKGEIYTFVGGHGKSYLDHVAVSNENECCVIDCMVLQDCKENVSDHLPVILRTNIQLTSDEPKAASWAKRVAWHKMEERRLKKSIPNP